MDTTNPQPSSEVETDPQLSDGQARSIKPSLEARLEALLFVSDQSLGVSQLSNALQVSSRKVMQALLNLERSLERRGIRLQKHGAAYQLTSAPSVAGDIERLLQLEETSSISRAALEALAIIAYQQPVTRPHIDSIRGVNSDSVLRTLLRHGLIEESGRSMSPGRPILYSTTSEFLQYFGLAAITDLPPLDPEMLSEIEDALLSSIPAES